MRNKTLNGVLSGVVLTFIFACNSSKQEPAAAVDKEQVKKEIQAKEDEFAATYNSGELKSIGYYADDAVSFYQNRAPLVGKQAIIDFLKSDLSSSSNKISFKTNEVFVSNDGSQVVEIGYFNVVDSANKTVNSGNYMSLFEKRNGKYVTLRDMSATDIPIE
jgi:ketosteroid isomerase-like protein